MRAASRAHTDRLTGSVHLLDMPFGALSEHVVQGRLPRAFLPSFLHEVTHYWCLATVVGAVASLLEMRAYREVALGRHSSDRLLHDLAVGRFIEVFLSPLLEGMALYAEFDTAPGDSDVFAAPCFWAGQMFQRTDSRPLNEAAPEKVKEWATQRIYSVLFDYRSSHNAVVRKTSVLMQPLAADSEGYLAGYMTVKRLWLSACRHTPAFRDRDYFLTFLREWMLQDWVLVDYMTDLAYPPRLAYHLLVDRIDWRIRTLATQDLQREAALFNAAIGRGQGDDATISTAMCISPDEAAPGHEMATSLVQELEQASPGQPESGSLYLADFATLQHRQNVVRLATEEVEIEVNASDRVLVRRDSSRDSVYLAGPAPEGAKAGVTRGWLAVCYLPQHRQMFTIATRESQSMLWIAPSSLSEPELAPLRAILTKVMATEPSRTAMRERCAETAAAIADEEYQSLTRAMPDLAGRFYTHFALSEADKDQLPIISERLSRKGFYDLLGRNGDLLTALVRISLLPALTSALSEFVRSDLKEEGIDLDEAIRQLQAIEQKHGVAILLPGRDGSLCCTV